MHVHATWNASMAGTENGCGGAPGSRCNRRWRTTYLPGMGQLLSSPCPQGVEVVGAVVVALLDAGVVALPAWRRGELGEGAVALQEGRQ